jgi:hypothetical protein
MELINLLVFTFFAGLTLVNWISVENADYNCKFAIRMYGTILLLVLASIAVFSWIMALSLLGLFILASIALASLR